MIEKIGLLVKRLRRIGENVVAMAHWLAVEHDHEERLDLLELRELNRKQAAVIERLIERDEIENREHAGLLSHAREGNRTTEQVYQVLAAEKVAA